MAIEFVWETSKWALMLVTCEPCRIEAVLVLFVGPWICVLTSNLPQLWASDWECVSLHLRCVSSLIRPVGSCLCFLPFYAQNHLHTFSDQHLWNPLDNDPILMLARAFIPLLCRIWWSKFICNEHQQWPAPTNQFPENENIQKNEKQQKKQEYPS
jgi:hypothetical protein